MINRLCRGLARALSNFKIIDFNKLLNAPDKRTDAEKIRHDFDKTLDKYKKRELAKTNSLFFESRFSQNSIQNLERKIYHDSLY